MVLRDQRRAILPDDDEVSIILARHYLDAPPAEQCWCPALGFFVDFSAMDVSKDTEESEDALGSSDWLDGLSLDTIPVLYDFRCVRRSCACQASVDAVSCACSFNGRALPFCSLGDATMADACSSLARLLTEHGLRLPSIGDDALDAISGSDIRFLHAAPDAATTRMDPFKQFRSLSFQITVCFNHGMRLSATDVCSAITRSLKARRPNPRSLPWPPSSLTCRRRVTKRCPLLSRRRAVRFLH